MKPFIIDPRAVKQALISSQIDIPFKDTSSINGTDTPCLISIIIEGSIDFNTIHPIIKSCPNILLMIEVHTKYGIILQPVSFMDMLYDMPYIIHYDDPLQDCPERIIPIPDFQTVVELGSP